MLDSANSTTSSDQKMSEVRHEQKTKEERLLTHSFGCAQDSLSSIRMLRDGNASAGSCKRSRVLQRTILSKRYNGAAARTA